MPYPASWFDFNDRTLWDPALLELIAVWGPDPWNGPHVPLREDSAPTRRNHDLPRTVRYRGESFSFCQSCRQYHLSPYTALHYWVAMRGVVRGVNYWKCNMKRPDCHTPASSAKSSSAIAAFGKQFPTLFEYLTHEKWDDGKPRDTSTVSLFIEGGVFKLALNDKDLSRSLYVSASSYADVWVALETALNDSLADWRPWGRHTKKK